MEALRSGGVAEEGYLNYLTSMGKQVHADDLKRQDPVYATRCNELKQYVQSAVGQHDTGREWRDHIAQAMWMEYQHHLALNLLLLNNEVPPVVPNEIQHLP